MNRLKGIFREILHYPSAIVGTLIIVLLVAIAIYAVVAIPYDVAINKWRGGETVWGDYPKTAAPVWYNWFSTRKMSESQIILPDDSRVTRTEKQLSDTS